MTEQNCASARPPALARALAPWMIAAAVLFGDPAGARAEGAWELSYDLDPEGGMNCAMDTYWDDGSKFSIFANGHGYVGFLIMDPAWSLPKGQTSQVSFRFGGRSYTFPVEVADTNVVVGNLASNESDALAFLERWARAYSMSIAFPNGDSWRVNLTGSMATLRQWSTCFDALEGRAGGTGNPFGGGSRRGGNPF